MSKVGVKSILYLEDVHVHTAHAETVSCASSHPLRALYTSFTAECKTIGHP